MCIRDSYRTGSVRSFAPVNNGSISLTLLRRLCNCSFQWKMSQVAHGYDLHLRDVWCSNVNQTAKFRVQALVFLVEHNPGFPLLQISPWEPKSEFGFANSALYYKLSLNTVERKLKILFFGQCQWRRICGNALERFVAACKCPELLNTYDVMQA